MEELKKLEPTGVLTLSDVEICSFSPGEFYGGVCVIMGILFALVEDDAYDFECLMIRRSGRQIFREPLVYKEKNRLVLKEVCKDIEMYMDGDLGSVYVQMKETRSSVSFGIALWNGEDYTRNFNTFSVAYHLSGLDENMLKEYINQVYLLLINNYQQLIEKMEMPQKNTIEDK